MSSAEIVVEVGSLLMAAQIPSNVAIEHSDSGTSPNLSIVAGTVAKTLSLYRGNYSPGLFRVHGNFRLTT
jgi:hypothetical protein